MIQESVQSLLQYVKSQENHPFPSPFYISVPNFREYTYTPHVIRIGPVDRHGQKLVYDGLKASYMLTLMSRIRAREEEILESCMVKVYDSMQKIQACYGDTFVEDSVEAMAKIMVTSACFILEFINKISEYQVESYRGNMLPDQAIIYDLVLLENQIPFFVLDDIFQCTVLKYKPNTTLVEFILPLLNLLNIFKADITIDNIPFSSTHHILSLLHECYKPQYPVRSAFLTSTAHSVTDLEMAGVVFKPCQDSKWLMGMDVKLTRFPCFSWFSGKPTLRMPVLHIHDFTWLVLRNLIAYEQQSGETHKYVTSYAYALDMLVNTQEDVSKLVDSSILINNLGSNAEAADIINNLCKQVARVHFFYGEEWEKLHNYCNGYWPKNVAWLKRTYFSSPWNIIALFAGIILFALTVVQTIFTVKSTISGK